MKNNNTRSAYHREQHGARGYRPRLAYIIKEEIGLLLPFSSKRLVAIIRSRAKSAADLKDANYWSWSLSGSGRFEGDLREVSVTSGDAAML